MRAAGGLGGRRSEPLAGAGDAGVFDAVGLSIVLGGHVEGRVAQGAGDGFAGGSFFDRQRRVEAAQAVRTDPRDSRRVAQVLDFVPPELARVHPLAFGGEQQITRRLVREQPPQKWLQPLRDLQAATRAGGLAERNDQNLAIVVDVAGDARAYLALAQPHVQHQQYTDRRPRPRAASTAARRSCTPAASTA